MSNLWFSLAAGLVLLIPGWSLLVWLPAGRSARKDPLAFLADGAAFSVSLAALLALWLMIFQIKTSSMGLVLIYGAGLAALLAGAARRWHFQAGWARGLALKGLAWALGIGLVAALAAWRFFQARDLALPAWVDSVHHALIVRKMLDVGGLPVDLQPYIPAPFFYHYGFHLVTALFCALTRLEPWQGVLWFGNVINALVGLSVYRAALTFLDWEEDASAGPANSRLRWWKEIAAALCAVLLVGFVFQMPAYYLTWGRYTLLTGLILIGPFVAAARDVWCQPDSKMAGVRLALLVAGLCVTHYLALLFAGLFLALLVMDGLVHIRAARYQQAVLGLVGWSALGLLLALPWVWKVALATQAQAQVQVISPLQQTEPAAQRALDYLQYILYLIGPRRSHILMGLAGLALLGTLRRRGMRFLAAWGILLSLLSLPWGIRIGPFRPDHYAIFLFFPASILVGDLLVAGVEALARLVQPGTLERPWFRPAVLAAVMAICLVWGLRETKSVLNQTTIFVDAGDVRALRWIQKNTPLSARFYINSTPWQGNVYRGVDGGYWLMPFTGRASVVPPSLYVTAASADVAQINDWVTQSQAIHGCTPAFWKLAADAHLTYVYLHQGKGKLQPAMLVGCEGVELIYAQSGVYLYALQPAH